MTRKDAIKFLTLMRKAVSNFEEYGHDKASMVIECDKAEAIDMAIEALSAKPQTDLISRADAIEAIMKHHDGELNQINYGLTLAKNELQALPSAELPLAELKQEFESDDAVQGWRIGKPTEQGKYMVTIDSFGHKRIDLFYYGKPLMPNRKVRGKCWYRSDDEWGDVVYDDSEIVAWQPLPKPYKGGDDE